jgi:hypothetical protein
MVGTGPSIEYTEAERRRLAGVLQQLHDEQRRLDREARGYLPQTFVMAYDRLVAAVFGEGKGYSSQLANLSDAPKQQLRDSWVVGDGGIRNERAHHARKKFDRKLRALARELQNWETGVSMLRCTVCKKFIESGWIHCAWCGRKQS